MLASWGDQVRNLTSFFKALTGSQNEMAESTGRTAEEVKQAIDSIKEGYGENPADLYMASRLRWLQEEYERLTATQKENVQEVEESKEVITQTATTVGDLRRRLSELDKAIEGSFDRETVKGFQEEIAILEHQLSKLLGDPERFTTGMEKPLNEVIDNTKELQGLIDSVDVSIPDKYFPPGSLGDLQKRFRALQREMLIATDPSHIEELKKQMEDMKDEMDAFGPTAAQSTRKADMAMGALGNSIGGVVGQLIAGKKEALSFGRILAAVAPALINVLTGGAGGFAANLAGGIFGGLFHGGGMVPGHGERTVKVLGGEMVLTRSQQKALGSMRSAPASISPAGLEKAFSKALSDHTRKLGPEEVFVMSEKGRRGF